VIDDAAYNSARTVWKIYGLLFKELINEYGEEKALKLHEKSFREHGEGTAEWLRSQVGDDVGLEKLGGILLGSLEASGFESDVVVESPYSVVVNNTKCPRYDGFKMAGLSDELVEKYCTMGGKSAIGRQLKLLDPTLGFGLRTFKPWDGLCEEHFYRTN